ncbi:hypothetical protein BDV96DRAFT_655180 [Lophiotrema nucula]|uniref:Uncharacterized protein n=1 Tax=Lophiotrema nucula TaxID=690887 RepID=A0A6A5YFR3_9PLEO|nr:hypothetical protein BDV96DRAFT_655180 [Lophiotrema nucula]
MADQKRKRADTHGTAVPTQPPRPAVPSLAPTAPQHDLGECIEALDIATVKQLLLQAAYAQPAVAASLRSGYDAIIQRERSRVVSFDHYSKSVWYSLNKKYSRLGGSKQIGTKQSGLETLRKIGKTICMSSNDVVGHEMKNSMGQNTCLEDAMLAILSVMTEVEKQIMCDIDDGRSTFLAKMEELDSLAKSYCVLKKLEEVVQELSGYGYCEDEDENDDEEGGR